MQQQEEQTGWVGPTGDASQICLNSVPSFYNALHVSQQSTEEDCHILMYNYVY
jgi:hypothetical protein